MTRLQPVDLETTAGRTRELAAALGEQIALTLAEANRCPYCAAVLGALGRMAGPSEEAIRDSRRGASSDRTVEAALRQVALSVFTNYFTQITRTAVDFPLLPDVDLLQSRSGPPRP